MHIGHSFETQYYIGEASATKELKAVQQEMDLGVIITRPVFRGGLRGLKPPRTVIFMIFIRPLLMS